MAKNPRPNVILIHAHDCGRAIQPYGWPVNSPNLLQFAREGVLFRKAYATSPTCGPARTALFTGEYPHQSGMFGLPGRDGWAMKDPSHHLVHVLNANGYLTALAGVQHEVNHADLSPLQYQRLLDTREQRGEHYPETLDKVEEFLQEPKDRPFFLSIGLDEPHRNNLSRPEIGVGNESARFSKTRLYDPDKLDWRYTPPPPWLPDIPEIRKDAESFNEGVRILDEYVGRLLAMIRHRGLEENTLVILTTDHGIEFTGGKKTLREQGTGVFLMLRGPGCFTGGKVIEGLVSHLDLAPTILEMAGIPQCAWHQGKSLLQLAEFPFAKLHPHVFTEQNYHGNLEALRAINDGRYKLVLHHDPIAYRMRHDGPTCPIMEAFGAYDQVIGPVALYDLYLDPMEACNRADHPAYADIRADLTNRLYQWMERTGDCFLTGDFPEKPASIS